MPPVENGVAKDGIPLEPIDTTNRILKSFKSGLRGIAKAIPVFEAACQNRPTAG